jgi:hypothetical protein
MKNKLRYGRGRVFVFIRDGLIFIYIIMKLWLRHVGVGPVRMHIFLEVIFLDR